jgi:DNA-binding NtrC family response regulator
MAMPISTSADKDPVSVSPDRAAQVLLVDDELLFAKAVAKRLGKAGYVCEVAGTLADARQSLAASPPDLIVLDMRLPDGTGRDFLAELRAGRHADIPVLVLTAYSEVEDAVGAMKLGAADYLKKPIDLDELLLNIDKVLSKGQLARRLAYSQKRESRAAESVQIVGESDPILDLRQHIRRIGELCADAALVPPTVLIQGETGTGKDLVARLLHAASARSTRPFVHVDCAALPPELIEAELFGHERGAFTSAVSSRTGLIEAAEDGTLFLDEIGELPVDLQVKLLAVLERRRMRRVGDSQERPVAAWFIAATNRDLIAAVNSRQFRSDLYYRLNVLSLRVPALKDRIADIPLLAAHFCAQTARRYHLAAPEFTPEAMQRLQDYPWPGNVRELKHLVERAVLLSAGAPIAVDLLGLPTAPTPVVSTEQDTKGLTLDEAEKKLIERALQESSGNVSEAARRLGITRMVMRYRMKKYGLAGS